MLKSGTVLKSVLGYVKLINFSISLKTSRRAKKRNKSFVCEHKYRPSKPT